MSSTDLMTTVNPSTVDTVRQALSLVASDPNQLATVKLQDIAQLFFQAGAMSVLQAGQGREQARSQMTSIEASHQQEHQVTQSRTNETIFRQPDGTQVTHRQIDQITDTKKQTRKMKLTQSRHEWIHEQVEAKRQVLAEQTKVALDSVSEPTHFRRLFRADINEAWQRLGSGLPCADWKKQWVLGKRRPSGNDLITTPLADLVPTLRQAKVLNWLQEKKIVQDKLLLGIETPELQTINCAEKMIRIPTSEKTYKATQAWNCTFATTGSVHTFTISLNRMLITHFYPAASRTFMTLVDNPKQLRTLQQTLDEQHSDDEDEDSFDEDDLDDIERQMESMPDDFAFSPETLRQLQNHHASKTVETTNQSNGDGHGHGHGDGHGDGDGDGDGEIIE
jgi:hypothetical protein